MDLKLASFQNKENSLLPDTVLNPYQTTKHSKPKTYKKKQPKIARPSSTQSASSSQSFCAKRNASDMDLMDAQDTTKKCKGLEVDNDLAAVAALQPCQFQ